MNSEIKPAEEVKSNGFPNFWKALAHRNVNEMLKECVRNKDDRGFIGRNDAIKDFILETPDKWTKKALKK